MANIRRDFENAVYYDTTLRPHRSMTDEGRRYFYGGILAAGALANYFAIKAGVWPAAVFLDLALGGLALGMAMSDRSSGEYQKIRLTDKGLEIRHFKPGFEKEEIARLSPYMLKIEAKMDRFERCEKVLLLSRTHKTEVGAFLPPDNKQKLAIELAHALEQYNMPHHLRKTDNPEP